MRGSVLKAIMLISAMALFAAAHEGHDDPLLPHTVKIGKTGEVAFGMPVRFGETLLRKGRFILEHRVEGNQHWIRLTPVPAKGPVAQTAPAVELPAKVGGAKGKVTKSEVLVHPIKDVFEIVRITIAGEDVEHFF
jgi:hypothetical protein